MVIAVHCGGATKAEVLERNLKGFLLNILNKEVRFHFCVLQPAIGTVIIL